MKADGSLKSLLQGVSQQPVRDRLPGQATRQTNMSSDPVTGLTRRAGTDLVKQLGSTPDSNGFYPFSTSDGNKFVAWFTEDHFKVHDLNGDSKTVNIIGSAENYITSGTGFRCSTDEDDTTYIVATNIKPSMLSNVPTYYNNETDKYSAIVQILGGQYGKKYRILINNALAAEHETADGSGADEVAEVSTAFIAAALVTAWTLPGYTITRREDIICITKSTYFKASVADGQGNVNVKCMNRSVPDTADLPRIAPHLYVVRVAQQTDPEKDMWFKFVVDGEEDNLTPSLSLFGQEGYWQECVAPDTKYRFNLATMPHLLTYDAGTGQFTLKQGTWSNRLVGTSTSNPDPSFIGTAIKDVGNFQGRLVFIAGSSVIMSRTNKSFDFWLSTTSALSDTDPIDINSTVDSSTLTSIVQHNRDLVLFSSKAQFIVYGRSKATPENVAMTLTTRFESDPSAHPVGAGKNVFFSSNYGKYSAIREFFAEGDTAVNDSRPITQHVKQYIYGEAKHLSSSSNYDLLLVHTASRPTSVYVYQYIWSDQEKVQSAWHEWTFEHSIVYSFFDEDRIYLIQRIDNGYYLLRMPLDIQPKYGINFPVHLDQQFDVLNVDKAFALPYSYLTEDDLLCVQATDSPNPGMTVPIASIDFDISGPKWVVTLRDSMAGGDIVVGTRYKSHYIPTMPNIKDQDGVVVGTGNLRIRSFLLSIENSGVVTSRSFSKWGSSTPVVHSPRVVGDVDNIIGEQTIGSAKFVLPFRQNADQAEIEVYTTEHTPMTILDVEWQGQYNKRGRRMPSGGGQ